MKFLERFWFGCNHCHDGEGCPVADQLDGETGELAGIPRGWRLGVLVVLVFIVPLLAAIGGAALGGQYAPAASADNRDIYQALGGVTGFFLGVALARLVIWALRRQLCTAADGGDA